MSNVGINLEYAKPCCRKKYCFYADTHTFDFSPKHSPPSSSFLQILVLSQTNNTDAVVVVVVVAIIVNVVIGSVAVLTS